MIPTTSVIDDVTFMPTFPATDQRGFARPFGAASDIGAVEVGATAPPPGPVVPPVVPPVTPPGTTPPGSTPPGSTPSPSTSGPTQAQLQAQNQAVILAVTLAVARIPGAQLLTIADLTGDGFGDPIVFVSFGPGSGFIIAINGITGAPAFILPIGTAR